jgi:hypothetical protein
MLAFRPQLISRLTQCASLPACFVHPPAAFGEAAFLSAMINQL